MWEELFSLVMGFENADNSDLFRQIEAKFRTLTADYQHMAGVLAMVAEMPDDAASETPDTDRAARGAIVAQARATLEALHG